MIRSPRQPYWHPSELLPIRDFRKVVERRSGSSAKILAWVFKTSHTSAWLDFISSCFFASCSARHCVQTVCLLPPIEADPNPNASTFCTFPHTEHLLESRGITSHGSCLSERAISSRISSGERFRRRMSSGVKFKRRISSEVIPKRDARSFMSWSCSIITVMISPRRA